MDKFGLDDKTINFIKSTLDSTFKNTEFFVFGSRAKNSFKEYSDIDIAIKSSEKISQDKINQILIEFENSNLPIEVDIVDLNNLKEPFKSIILPTLKQL